LAGSRFVTADTAPGYDHDALETAVMTEFDSLVEETIARQVSGVECTHEEGELAGGQTVPCTANVDGHAVRIAAQIEATDPEVDITMIDLLYDVPALAPSVGEKITKVLDVDLDLNCGQGLRVVPTGGSFDCTATDIYGDSETIRIAAYHDGEHWDFA
jgi:hypothetical protein